MTLENDIPLFRRRHDEVSISQENKSDLSESGDSNKAKEELSRPWTGWPLSAHYQRTLDSTFVGVYK